MKHFTQFEHPEYKKMLPKWQLVQQAYTGEDLGTWLVMNRLGEAESSFAERKQLATFLPYTASVVDALVGVAFADEHEVERSWGPLGDPTAAGSHAYELSRDADGQGTNYDTFLRQATIDLLLYERTYVFVDMDEVTGLPRLRRIPATAVPNWIGSPTTEAIIKEEADTRRSLMDEPRTAEQYLYVNPAGWARYQKGKEGEPVLIEEGNYSDHRQWMDRHGRPTAPLIRIDLPWKRYVAYTLAAVHKAIYNQQSDADHRLRNSSYAKLVLALDDDAYEAQRKELAKGSNLLQLPPDNTAKHEYISPSTDAIDVAREGLKDKVQTFYATAFNLLNLEGQVQKTATEIVAERSTGLQAALSMISASIEDLDSACLYMMAQALTEDRAGWLATSSTWTHSYQDVSLELPE